MPSLVRRDLIGFSRGCLAKSLAQREISQAKSAGPVIAVVMLPLSYGLSVLFFRVLVALEKMSGPKASKSPNLPG